MADAPTPPSTNARRRRRGGIGADAIRWVVVVLVVVFAVRVGWSMRAWTYEHTTTLRHVEDVRNNFYYGSRAVDEGWLDLYANVRAERPAGNYTLDYVPLRLLVMRQWAAWARATYGPDVRWRPDLAFTRPLLLFNATMEGVAAVAAFGLALLWLRRHRAASDAGDSIGRWYGVPPAMAAAALVWFSPASMLSAQGWPSSDAWVVTFYLCAVLLACTNAWFCSGLVLGVGVMFKGQQMLVVPLFVLWPLFMGNGRATLRWMGGFALATGAVVSPWLLRDGATHAVMPLAVAWVAGVVVACGLLATVARFRPATWHRAALMVVAGALLVWPWAMRRDVVSVTIAVAACVLVLTCSHYLSFRRHVYLTAGTLAGALLTLPMRFPSDLSWLDVAFKYGSAKFPTLAQYCANTLPALLELRFGWASLADPVFRVGQTDVTVRVALTAVYGVGLVACAAAMARHVRRRDKHFLIAVAAPWLIAYAFMPQMHARYLLFGASAAAAAGALGVGMWMLGALLAVLAWCGIAHLMVDRVGSPIPSRLGELLPSQDLADAVQTFLIGAHPDLAWGIMMLAIVYLFLSLSPSRGR